MPPNPSTPQPMSIETVTLGGFAPAARFVKQKPAPKSGNKIYNLSLLKAFPHKLEHLKQDGEIGLEIECEGTKLFDSPISWWQTHEDGSLRAVEGQRPIEYVLRKPIPRGDVPKALSYLSK